MIKKISVLTILLATFLLLYFVLNLCFLENFPFMHSDESWLGGLSRNMLSAHSMSVTEPFFDLKVRHPHAIKSLFHLLQIVFIRVFGYRLFTLRLLSLCVAVACLIAFYKAGERFFDSRKLAFLCMLTLSFDIQFIYAAHFARSEIMLCLALCLSLRLLLKSKLMVRDALYLALISGLAIFIHPNCFFIACMCGTVLLWRGFIQKQKRLILIYIAGTAVFALAAVLLSYSMDSHFLRNYLSYGNAEFGVLAPVGEKLSESGGFFARLWEQNSGTYYVPDIRPQLVLFAFSAAISLFFALTMRREFPEKVKQLTTLLLAGAGLICGMVLLGRFNQTSIVFLFPIGWLLTVYTFVIISEEKCVLITSVVVIFMAVWSFRLIQPWQQKDSYQNYLAEIAEFVTPQDVVLANLNTGFYFDNDALHDLRNLPFLQDDIKSYVHEQGIEYIFYSDELDFLYENRPYFNVIYGNIMFVADLKRFCLEECEMVGSFTDQLYGVRIRQLMGDENYGKVTVYRVP